jgi:hypothetical protein
MGINRTVQTVRQVSIQDLRVSSCISSTRKIERCVQLITLGARKQSKDGGFGSRPLISLSSRTINRQTANGIADVQQSPSATSNPVPPDGAPHLNCTTCHTTHSNLEEISIVYSPLIGDAIRLLHIHPSVNKTLGLEADLVHFPLLSAQLKNYKALSYTWGVEKASVSIAINGGSMLIRPNLEKILRKLRALKYEYVWVSP